MLGHVSSDGERLCSCLRPSRLPGRPRGAVCRAASPGVASAAPGARLPRGFRFAGFQAPVRPVGCGPSAPPHRSLPPRSGCPSRRELCHLRSVHPRRIRAGRRRRPGGHTALKTAGMTSPPICPALSPSDIGRVRDVLGRYWGYEALRPFQAEAIACELAGQDSLTVLPTGGGKSLCYQIPPLLDATLDVVVSPLISLMKDQVDGLCQSGYPAAALHSGLEAADRRAVQAALEARRRPARRPLRPPESRLPRAAEDRHARADGRGGRPPRRRGRDRVLSQPPGD